MRELCQLSTDAACPAQLQREQLVGDSLPHRLLDRMRTPVQSVKDFRGDIRRKRDLLDVGAVRICREDALPAVDVHAENDSRSVRRPLWLKSEVPLSAYLQLDRSQVGATGSHNKELSVG